MGCWDVLMPRKLNERHGIRSIQTVHGLCNLITAAEDEFHDTEKTDRPIKGRNGQQNGEWQVTGNGPYHRKRWAVYPKTRIDSPPAKRSMAKGMEGVRFHKGKGREGKRPKRPGHKKAAHWPQNNSQGADSK